MIPVFTSFTVFLLGIPTVPLPFAGPFVDWLNPPEVRLGLGGPGEAFLLGAVEGQR